MVQPHVWTTIKEGVLLIAFLQTPIRSLQKPKPAVDSFPQAGYQALQSSLKSFYTSWKIPFTLQGHSILSFHTQELFNFVGSHSKAVEYSKLLIKVQDYTNIQGSSIKTSTPS
ncbi:hypothetical protein GOBAR_DD26314 [Gossypium barbadense]|nr:hypothetical protein GOBAR_DD26314 [Gossypium barbadense]